MQVTGLGVPEIAPGVVQRERLHRFMWPNVDRCYLCCTRQCRLWALTEVVEQMQCR
jgi:hypothetical protein